MRSLYFPALILANFLILPNLAYGQVDVPLTNPSCASGNTADVPNGWSQSSGSDLECSAPTSCASGFSGAQDGDNAIFADVDGASSGTVEGVRQTVDLSSFGAGNEGRTFTFSAFAQYCFPQEGGTATNDQARLQIEFLGTADNVLGTQTSLEGNTTIATGSWEEVNVSGVAPVGTRKVRVSMACDSAPFTQQFCEVTFDNASLSADGVLPVELTAFDAALDGAAALLMWQTASETNNSGFEIQHRPTGTDAWTALDWVDGAGTTLEAQSYSYRAEGLAPGRYTFRLRQVDLDGSDEFSPIVELTVPISGTALLSAASPNPFGERTALTLTVAHSQHVEAAAYDLLGRRVALLHSGQVEGQEPVRLTFSGAALAAGTYLIRAEGETFSISRSVVLR
jgi:hypothetical protein